MRLGWVLKSWHASCFILISTRCGTPQGDDRTEQGPILRITRTLRGPGVGGHPALFFYACCCCWCAEAAPPLRLQVVVADMHGGCVQESVGARRTGGTGGIRKVLQGTDARRVARSGVKWRRKSQAGPTSIQLVQAITFLCFPYASSMHRIEIGAAQICVQRGQSPAGAL